MSHLRQVTKRHSHYLVRYECDSKLQVRTTGFFHTGEKIMVGQTYNVQWGLSKKEADTATVLVAGTSEECQTAMKATLENDGKQKKRKATTSEAGQKKKAIATPLRIALPCTNEISNEQTPPAEERDEAAPLNAEKNGDVSTGKPNFTAPVSSLSADESLETLTQDQQEESVSSPTTPGVFVFDGTPSSPSTPRAYRQSGIASISQLLSTVNVLVSQNQQLLRDNRKLQQCVERHSTLMTKLVSEVGELTKMVHTVSVRSSESTSVREQTLSSPVEDIINSEYGLSDSEIHSIKSDSNNAGHFAANLVKRLYPELFGVANFRHQFNWYGGGKLGKKELCKERKYLVKQYVARYYPEHRDESSFKDSIVPKVNELLRRKDKPLKGKENLSEPEMAPLDGNLSFTSFLHMMES